MKEVSFWKPLNRRKPLRPKSPLRPRPFGFDPNPLRIKFPKNNLFDFKIYPARSKSELRLIDINPLGDKDKDGLMNWFDCKPGDKKRRDKINDNKGPKPETLRQIKEMQAAKKKEENEKVAGRLYGLVAHHGEKELAKLIKERDKERARVEKSLVKQRKQKLKQIAYELELKDKERKERERLERSPSILSEFGIQSLTSPGAFKPVPKKSEDEYKYVFKKEKDEKGKGKKGKWVRVNVTKEAEKKAIIRTQGGWLTGLATEPMKDISKAYRKVKEARAEQLTARSQGLSAEQLVAASGPSDLTFADKYERTAKVMKFAGKVAAVTPSAIKETIAYKPSKKAAEFGKGVQKGVAGVAKALFSTPLQSSGRGKGRPSGPSGKYFIEGNPVYEEQYQQYRSKQRALNRMSPSAAQSAPLTAEQIQSVEQLQLQQQTQLPMPEEMTQPEQMQMQMQMQRQMPVQAEMPMPTEDYLDVKGRQLQEQLNDNILKAPNFMKGELKATGGNILTPTGPQILDAPQVLKGQMRTLNRQNPQEFSEVKLSQRPQTNPMGSEFLDIELGSGKPVIRRRITEKFMTGEAL